MGNKTSIVASNDCIVLGPQELIPVLYFVNSVSYKSSLLPNASCDNNWNNTINLPIRQPSCTISGNELEITSSLLICVVMESFTHVKSKLNALMTY